MTNYNVVNIYRKQMKELGLNTKQYAELIEMPYEVVKDIIYDKGGEYSMEIKSLLRNTMFNKHQEIENDFENAKYKAMEIKRSDVDYLEWYNNYYSVELLKNKLKVNSVTDFERKYRIMVNGKRASHWFYTILCSNREYDGHNIEVSKKMEFISQLYDILINENYVKYLEETPIKNVRSPQEKKTKAFYLNWYRNFDVKKFVKENHISNSTLEKELNFSPAVISRLINKRRFSDNGLQRLYDYVIKTTNNIDYFNWFKNFDLKDYMAQNNLTNSTLGMKIGLGIVSTSQLANKRFYTKKTLEKLYNYIHSQKASVENEKEETLETVRNDLYKARINGDKQLIDEAENKYFDKVYEENDKINEDDNNPATKLFDNVIKEEDIEKLKEQPPVVVMYQGPKIELENTNDDILRKILINRLTDEEKELIRIFGGKLC